MTPWAFDTETEKTRAGCKAPPMACLTHQSPSDAGPLIVHARDARPVFEAKLHDPDVVITGHFVAYDMAVCAAAWPDLVPAIFKAYADDRVTCTMLREKLFDIAKGDFRGYFDERGVWRRNDYNLEAVARRRAGIVLKKDGWRRRYGEVIPLPLNEWPAYAAAQKLEAIKLIDAGVKDADLEAIATGDPNEILLYPLEDARATLGTYLGQEAIRVRCDTDPFADEFRQARASFWLNLMTTWGVKTRAAGVEALRIQTQEAIDELTESLIAAGLVRGEEAKKKAGSRDTKAAIARMLEVCGWVQHEKKEGRKSTYTYEPARPNPRPLRKTDSGNVSLDRDACEASDDELLIDYGDRAQLKAVLDKDVPMLAAGTYFPIHTRIDIAQSGRITSSAPNLTNLRRLPGIREAIVPRDGWVFAQADFPGLELHTLAQACLDLFGASELARMLNAGIDPHLAFAAKVVGLSYEEAKKARKDKSHPRHKEVENARQIGKVFNFGSPGGLGAETLITFARKTYGVVFDPDPEKAIEIVKEHKRTWLETLPEMKEFFAYAGRLTEATGEGTILQLRSKRIRGGAPFCALCNSWFQGLGADAAKHAGFLISSACYADKGSPLYGSRIVNFIHDEFITETRDTSKAHEAAHEQARLMQIGANEFVPDVPFKDGEIEPQTMHLWSKDAEALHDENGRLVPWEPALAGMLGLGRALHDREPKLRVAA